MKKVWKSVVVAAGLVLGLGGASNAVAADLTGAGATFPYPIYAKWASAYHKEKGIGLNYQSIGSGGGIKQIRQGTVDFGASDKPLTPDELKDGNLMQFPMIMGGVVPVINLPGIKPGELKLTGEVLAQLFMGKIKKWDDPAIKKLNPGLKIPSQRVTVVHRSDGSGTTFLFVHYLSAVSKNWEQKVGTGVAVSWPTGLGGKGNEGVASYVKTVKGSIGYVELAYAEQNKMTYTQLQNRDGQFVNPSIATFQAAAANADWANAQDFYLVLTNQPGAESWPITGASFILMHKQQKKADTARQALDFFTWAFEKGDQMATDLHYVPMPDNVVEMVKKAWAAELKGPDGKPVR